jgi:hypothetical protein
LASPEVPENGQGGPKGESNVRSLTLETALTLGALLVLVHLESHRRPVLAALLALALLLLAPMTLRTAQALLPAFLLTLLLGSVTLVLNNDL